MGAKLRSYLRRLRSDATAMRLIWGGLALAFVAAIIAAFLFDRGYDVAGRVLVAIAVAGVAPTAIVLIGGQLLIAALLVLRGVAWALVGVWVTRSVMLSLFAGRDRRKFLDGIRDVRRVLVEHLWL